MRDRSDILAAPAPTPSIPLREAADIAGVTVHAVGRAIRAGNLQAHRAPDGRAWLVTASDLADWLARSGDDGERGEVLSLRRTAEIARVNVSTVKRVLDAKPGLVGCQRPGGSRRCVALADLNRWLGRPRDAGVPDLVTIVEAAAAAGVSDTVVRQAIAGKQLAALRPAGSSFWRIERAAVDDWLKLRAVRRERRRFPDAACLGVGGDHADAADAESVPQPSGRATVIA